MVDAISGRTCLVTGGAGFSGSHLCRALLAREARVIVYDTHIRPRSLLVSSGDVHRVEVIEGDVRDLQRLREIVPRADIVFHLAAQPLVPVSNAFPWETLSVNVLGTYTVLEAIRTAAPRTRLVFASSGAYYGAAAGELDENSAPQAASNLYAPSKMAADEAVRSYALTFGLRAAVCRFMNTYGPGDLNYGRMVPRALQNLVGGLPYDFGDRDDGSTSLAYLHIRDMADAYLAVADHLDEVSGEAFNFGGERAISNAEIARAVSRAFDEKEREPIFHGVPQARPRIKVLSTKKARHRLGWRPHITLEAGLRETAAWYRRHP